MSRWELREERFSSCAVTLNYPHRKINGSLNTSAYKVSDRPYFGVTCPHLKIPDVLKQCAKEVSIPRRIITAPTQ
jgi:hypothetical protein